MVDDTGDTLGWAVSAVFDSAKGAVLGRSASVSVSGSIWAEFALPLQRSPPLRPDTDLDAALKLVWKGDEPGSHDRWSHGSVSLPARLAPSRRAMAV